MNKMLFSVMVLCTAGILLWATGQKEDGIMRIGVSMAAQNSFIDGITDAMTAQAEESGGIELVFFNADGDVDRQRRDVESMIVRGVDALILNPLDKVSLGHSVNAVKEAGIPLVEVNTNTDNDSYDTYVGSDDVKAGRIQGEWILSHIGLQGNVCVITGSKGHSGQIGRLQGLYEEMHSPGSSWRVLGVADGGWSRSEGKRIAEEWLARMDDIHVIAAQNDEMALGALAAVRESGRTISVLGIDGDPEALESISRGGLNMTVFQDRVSQGKEAVKAAYNLVRGGQQVKFMEIPFREITLNNIDEYRDSRVSMK